MIRVGIGGWTYAPWRGTFYPKELRQADELAHASRQLTTIEINGTFYRGQSPESFAKWRDETPEGFVFSVKGHRAIVNKRKLAEAAESLDWFLKGGVMELGDRLGPFLWQFPPYRRFDRDDLAGFLGMLPGESGGRALRHAVEVRHESFLDPEALDLFRERGAAVVTVESEAVAMIGDVTGDFVYARLQRTREDEAAGYPPAELDAWAARARGWAAGEAPDDLPRHAGEPAKKTPRDVFVYMIAGAKVRAPAAAVALLERVGR